MSNPLPDRETLLRFITENPDRATKRDIAKAFGLKGADRVLLKDILRDFEDEGLIERRRKQMVRPGGLPPVTLLDVTARDRDGGLIGRPAEWNDDDGVPPAVSIRVQKGGGQKGKAGPAAGVGDRVLAKIFRSKEKSGPAYTARVIKVIDRRERAQLGVFRAAPGGGGRILPIQRQQNELVVDADDTAGAADGDLVEVETTRAGRFGLTRAKVLEIVGSAASEKAISMIAIHAHGIPHVFPDAVIVEAEAAKPATMAHREDWRSLPIVTIDPSDAKDHDDAVHAEPDTAPDNEGGHVVTVAIADVAYYVQSGSPLDREALKRGNSVYFPDRVVPMLPERISNDLCSLKEGVDRPALAVRMTFDRNGHKLRHSFHRVMIRSIASLAYSQAQAAVDGATDDKTDTLLDGVLRPLWAAYATVKRGRDKRQPLELDLPERRLVLDKNGRVDRVIVPERLEAHRLIEEFMIQANVAAAESLERKRQTLIYRVHDAPSLAKQETLRDFLGTLDMNLARGNLRANHFNQILGQAQGKAHEVMVSEMVLRTQSQAIYSPDNLGHFGLNLLRYAHFTSPIRRYADLIVHRALIGSLGLGDGGITPDEEAALIDISADISASERRAMAAERETIDRLVAHYLAGHVNDTFDGRVAGVTKSGLFISLPQYGADGFVPISTLGQEYFVYDEAHQALSGTESGRGYRLGDAVEVRLVEALPLAGALRFEMLSEPRKMPTGIRSFHKGKAGAKAGQRRGAKKPGTRPPRGRR